MSDNENKTIVLYQSAGSGGMLASSAGFEHAQRLAKMFASSEMIPPQWRGKVADCTIALAMAEQMGESPIMVLQSMHVVSGRAGFAATYMIARANRSGALRGRIGWRIEGAGDTLAVTAHATLADTGEVVEYRVTMAMARAEGWTKNAKYQSMPELMLRYRSASALIRLYLPDVMLGYHAVEDLETLPAAVDVTPEPPRETSADRVRAAVSMHVEPDRTQQPARKPRQKREDAPQAPQTGEAAPQAPAPTWEIFCGAVEALTAEQAGTLLDIDRECWDRSSEMQATWYARALAARP